MIRSAALALVVMLAACAPTGAAADAARVQSLTVAAAPADVYRAAVVVAAEYGWTVTHSDADARLVTATYPSTGGRWDDTVSVTVAPSGTGSVVTARSGLGNGPNVAHVRGFMDALRARVNG